MAAAARLAKLGHEVTLLERAEHLGGALTTVEHDGFAWDAGPTTTLLPAVVRDLFRKSGRPLERELDLQPLDLVREHRFADGSSVRLPGGSRAAQLAAVDVPRRGPRPAVGRPRGVVRRAVGAAAQGVVRAALRPRRRATRARGAARPARVAAQAAAPALRRRAAAAGRRPPVRHGRPRPARVPVLAGVDVYLEQRFGSWTVPGGLAALGVAMADRLALRGVTVLTGTPATTSSCATAGSRRSGPRAARSTPTTSSSRSTRGGCPPSRRTSGARCLPSRRSCATWGSRARCPTCPTRWCSTATRLLVVRTGGRAPDGAAAWTVLARGRHRRGRPDGAGAPRPRRPQTGRRPRRPHAARPRRAHGAARRTACSGRAPHGPRAARPADADRRRAGRRARTPPPGRACRSPGSVAALVAEMVGRAERQ